MIKTLVKGSLAGTVVLVAWNMFSWMALGPWHAAAFATFKDEAAMAKVITAQAAESGVYLLPNSPAAMAAATPETRKAVEEKCQAAMKAGPTAFVVVHKDGMDMKTAMGPMVGRAAAAGAVASLVVTWILLQVSVGGFVTRYLVAVLAGAGGSVMTAFGEGNWWWFSDRYVHTVMLDAVIGWALAGLALAALTGKRKKR